MGLKPLSQSINFPTKSAAARIAGIKISPKAIASSDSLLFKVVICPFRLSCMTDAIFCEAPSQFSMEPRSLSISSGAAFINARKPLIAFVPTIASALAVCSDSDILENA